MRVTQTKILEIAKLVAEAKYGQKKLLRATHIRKQLIKAALTDYKKKDSSWLEMGSISEKFHSYMKVKRNVYVQKAHLLKSQQLENALGYIIEIPEKDRILTNAPHDYITLDISPESKQLKETLKMNILELRKVCEVQRAFTQQIRAELAPYNSSKKLCAEYPQFVEFFKKEEKKKPIIICGLRQAWLPTEALK